MDRTQQVTWVCVKVDGVRSDRSSRLKRMIAAAIGLLVAVCAGSQARAVPVTVRQTVPATVDCAVLAYRGGWLPLVPRFQSMEPSDRQQCLSQLFQSLSGENRPGTFQDDSALAVEELAKAGFIEDRSYIRPLIECIEQSLRVETYCNRTLASLTRQSYGLLFFSGETRMPVKPAEHHKRVVADWKAYESLLGGGHPIFDSFLADACASAIRSVKARLVETLGASVPSHVILSYLRGSGPSTIPRKQGQAQVIYYFGLGDIGLGRGFVTPGNWLRSEPPSGLRILMFRPGVSHPASDLRPEQEIQQFPVEDADYRELFPALDLEIRFQIVTPDGEQRRTTIRAVYDALSGLRAANALVR